MKKIVAMLLVLTLVLCAAATAEETIKFTMGFDPEYQPYTYRDAEGEYAGFDIDVARAACDVLGWELVLHPVDWNTKMMELDTGAVDCIWSGLTINNIPEDSYTLSLPYVDSEQVIVVKVDSGIETLADLTDKRVGVQGGTSAYDMLTNGSQKELGETFETLSSSKSYNVCFADLESGFVDAVAVDISMAKSQIAAQSNPADYVILSETLGPEQYGICFRKDDEDTCLQIQRAIDQLVTSGEYEKIAEKYIEKEVDDGGLKRESLILLREAAEAE